MKLLALLAIALGLLSAGPADARHHHRGWQVQHSAMPMPRERPSKWKEVMPLEQRVRSSAARFSPDEIRPQQAMSFAGAATATELRSNAVAWQPSTSPWRADEAFSRAAWIPAAQWQEVSR